MMGNLNAPVIRPEHQKEYQKSLSMQSPSQSKFSQKQQLQMKRMKKELYVQKYKESKHLAGQQINEESYQTESSGEEDDDEAEYGQEHQSSDKKKGPHSMKGNGESKPSITKKVKGVFGKFF